MRKTKIVATIGPASESREILRQLIEAGMNVARLNFSHGELSWHKTIIDHIRGLSLELDTPIAILGDIQGPRIRIQVQAEISVVAGEQVLIGDIAHGIGELDALRGKFLLLDQPGIIGSIQPGDAILIADGALQLKALEFTGGFLRAEVLNDGVIRNKKGVNLPDSPLNLPVITAKDERDLEFIVREGLDYVGLSFVGSAEDIELTREKMRAFASSLIASETAAKELSVIPSVVAKIERKEALKNLKKIVKAADAVMVARGDLGIEMPETEVALLQKRIVAESLRQVRPVIVATQMLRSMVDNPRPTRAEVSDVTNAVIDHADAIMLSEESAAGQYPVEAVAIMREIADKTEESPYDDIYQELSMNLRSEFAVVVRSVYQLARSYDARAIVIISRSGFSARVLSHFRPEGRLLVGTTDVTVWRRLALVWGVDGYLFEAHTGTDGLAEKVVASARIAGVLRTGDRVVVCLGRDTERDTLQLVGVREVTG